MSIIGSLAGCATSPLSCAGLAGSATGDLIASGANSLIGAWAQDFQKAEATMLQTLMGSWLSLKTPNVNDSSSSAVQFLTANTAYLTGLCGIIGLMIAGARMAWYQRAEPAREALAGLLRLIIVQGSAVIGVGLLTAASDSLSTSIMSDAVASAGASSRSLGAISVSVLGSAALVIVLSSVAILAFLLQLVLLIVRSALMVLIAGTLPLSAAASIAPVGNSWFRKNVGWLLAFVLFKPVAALVYGAAILSATSSNDVTGSITGIVLVALATLTLPALMRLVAPMVSAVGNISVAQAAGVAAGVATGAIKIAATGGAAAPMVAAGAAGAAGGLAKGAVGPAPGGPAGGGPTGGSGGPSSSGGGSSSGPPPPGTVPAPPPPPTPAVVVP